ncbi:MAG TPA: DinB family protein, partial [bacterium]|nr:DinB family protein [bacterium]
MTTGRLATHIANLPTWVGLTLGGDRFDMAPPGQDPPRAQPAESPDAAVETFDRNVAAARAALAAADDATMTGAWTLLAGGQTVFTMPRVAVLRSFVMNHVIHHRAQLTVYLRLCDVPVPALYGPSADES